jgi:ParB family chromosome partitioning protein
LKLPSDFGNEISKALNWKLEQVAEWFTLEEDKEGYFWARLKPKKFLEKPEFKTMCALARDLGGEGYLEGAKAWAVPGPCAKKADTTSTPEDARGKPSAGPRPEAEKEPSGVKPNILSDDKRKPVEIPNIKFIPIDGIEAPSFLPTRELISHERLAEIRQSIKKHGLKYPIKVRPGPDPGTYELKDGFLRLKSVQQLGWKEIPAEIKETSDHEVIVESLIMNKHRIEEDPITVAKKLDILVNAFGYTHEKIAEELGVSRPWVSDTIRFLKLPKEVQHCLALDNVSRYHGLLLLTIEDQQLQKKLAKDVVDEGLSTRQLDDRIRQFKPQPSLAPKAPESPVGFEPAKEARRAVQPESKPVLCAHCGEPVGTPIHLEGKFYHEECAEQVQGESEPGLIPETQAGLLKKEPTEKSEPPKPKPQKIDTGFQWICPECGRQLQLLHVKLPNGKITHQFEGDD